MTLLSRTACALLLANYRDAMRDAIFDPFPLVRLFNPLGSAVWLASELHEDGDTLYGLADLGFGCPELGLFSLRAIEAVYLPLGKRIELDRTFTTRHRLSVWAEAARATGSLHDAATLLGGIVSEDPAALRLLFRDHRS